MLSKSTKYKLWLLLKAISENEVIVEEQRQRLSAQPDYEPYAAFKRVERAPQPTGASAKITAYNICQYLRDNMVDYADEVECNYMVKFFDKDEDGHLTFEDFLQMTLPCDNAKSRADAVQRPNYRVAADQTLPRHVEYELSRLFEKEMHYHLKVEGEKKTLERQVDFSTVAAFTVLDQQRRGYIDFESIRKFMVKYKKEVSKADVNAIIRRMDVDADGKITFREFSHGITPEYPGTVGGSDKRVDFNVDKKQEIKRQHEELKQQTIKKDTSLSPLRDYRQIYGRQSPVRQEFHDMRLKQTVAPESQYIVDLIKMGSPIGKVIRRDMEANVRSPIRPYGDASFLSMREDFFGERTREQPRSYDLWQPQVREEAYHGESNPTI